MPTTPVTDWLELAAARRQDRGATSVGALPDLPEKGGLADPGRAVDDREAARSRDDGGECRVELPELEVALE